MEIEAVSSSESIFFENSFEPFFSIKLFRIDKEIGKGVAKNIYKEKI